MIAKLVFVTIQSIRLEIERRFNEVFFIRSSRFDWIERNSKIERYAISNRLRKVINSVQSIRLDRNVMAIYDRNSVQSIRLDRDVMEIYYRFSEEM